MNAVQKTHDLIDRVFTKSIAASGFTPTCSKGCFHCCKEFAMASRPEAKQILSMMTGVQKAALTLKAEAWLETFLSGGANEFDPASMKDCLKYRALNLYCPLLGADHLCSVYADRPNECRIFATTDNPVGCEKDELRQNQHFLRSPGIVDLMMKCEIATLQIGESIDFDHLGILLAEELLGGTYETRGRLKVKKVGENDFEFTKYDVDKQEATP